MGIARRFRCLAAAYTPVSAPNIPPTEAPYYSKNGDHNRLNLQIQKLSVKLFTLHLPFSYPSLYFQDKLVFLD